MMKIMMNNNIYFIDILVLSFSLNTFEYNSFISELYDCKLFDFGKNFNAKLINFSALSLSFILKK